MKEIRRMMIGDSMKLKYKDFDMEGSADEISDIIRRLAGKPERAKPEAQMPSPKPANRKAGYITWYNILGKSISRYVKDLIAGGYTRECIEEKIVKRFVSSKYAKAHPMNERLLRKKIRNNFWVIYTSIKKKVN